MSSRSSVAPTSSEAKTPAAKVSIRRASGPMRFVMSSLKPPANAGMADSASIVSPYADTAFSHSIASIARTLAASAAAIATPPTLGVGVA